MKNILLITLLLIPVLGFSQTTKPIDGFLGIKFGSSKADVIAALQKRQAVAVQTNNPNILIYKDVTFGHRPVIELGIYFVDDKVYSGALLFKAEVDDKTVEYYNSLVNDLNDVYGPGRPTRLFKEPYKDGDGFEISGIQEGDVTFFTDWGDYSTNVNSIEVSISTKLYVKILYTDTELAKLAEQKQKAKDSGDY